MDELADLLRRFSSHPIYFRPNQGNGGDALIASGTFRYFERHQLSYKLLSKQSHYDFPPSSVVVYGGGGIFVGGYTGGRDFLKAIHRIDQLAALVILPHTINGQEQWLSVMGTNTHIFCREAISYQYVKDTAPQVNVYLREDMAFELDPKTYLKNRDSNRPIKLYLKQMFEKLRHGRLDWRVLNAFRKDVEKSACNIPVDNIDVSMRINDCVMMDVPHLVDRTTSDIFSFLNYFGTVNTNRLHIAIASALLDKRVNFYPNSYYKNQAMYEQSLSRFPNVRFVPEG